MALQEITFEELRELIADRASVTIGTSGRHTEAQLKPLVNDSINKYWQYLGAESDWVVKRAEVTTSAASTSTEGWDDNQHVIVASDVLQIKAVGINDGNQWITMQPFEYLEQDAFDGDYTGPTQQIPIQYRLAINDAQQDILHLQPRADGEYTIRYDYIRMPAEITCDQDKFSYFPGTVEFVVCDVAQRLLARDMVPDNPHLQLIIRQRDEALDFLQRMARERNRTGPGRRVDTRGLRTRAARYAYSPWRSR